jgi:hypothetical protein
MNIAKTSVRDTGAEETQVRVNSIPNANDAYDNYAKSIMGYDKIAWLIDEAINKNRD